MLETTEVKFKSDFEKEIRRCIDNHDALKIHREDGESVIVISESDWGAIVETLYLNQIPGFVESIHEAASEPISEGTPLEELDW